MDLLKRYKQYIKEENLFSSGDYLLLAVSGGLDSMVLASLCKEAGYNFTIAHCNFQLRGNASDEDENFVAEFASKNNIPFFSKKFDTENFTQVQKMGIQEAARKLRYDWFNELIEKGPGLRSASPYYDVLLTAHHADDNVETLLMNFFKGTGIKGLHGILPKNNRIVRPLLFVFKEEILAYAKVNHIAYREDLSNASNKYSRNYFRNELIPSVEKVFPQAIFNINNNIPRFRDAGVLYQYAVEKILKDLIEKRGEEVHIPILKLSKTAALSSIVYELISSYGFSAHQVNDVLKLMVSGSGKYVASASHRILNNRKWLIIAPLKEKGVQHFVIEKEMQEIAFGDSVIKIEAFSSLNVISPEKNIAQLDGSMLNYPLLLRKWKRGDYFYPLGMKKKKKLSRFFIDEKIPLFIKDDIWVLECGGKIVWVIGYRIDDRFKITNKTKSVIQFTRQ